MTSVLDPAQNLARQALARYASRAPATQTDVDRVMRALVEHDSWWVSTFYAQRTWGQSTFDQVIEFNDAAPNTMLTVFTDRESALRAEGYPIGPYGGPVDGRRLLGTLDGAYSALVVNPASPREHQWFISEAGFPIAKSWAECAVLEASLHSRGEIGLPVARLLAHATYQVLLINAENTLAMVDIPGVDGQLAICFTAGDRAEDFLEALPEPARETAGLVEVDGPQLFGLLREVGSGGVVINAGPRQEVLLRADVEALTAVASAA
jgi:hypothetical protein